MVRLVMVWVWYGYVMGMVWVWYRYGTLTWEKTNTLFIASMNSQPFQTPTLIKPTIEKVRLSLLHKYIRDVFSEIITTPESIPGILGWGDAIDS